MDTTRPDTMRDTSDGSPMSCHLRFGVALTGRQALLDVHPLRELMAEDADRADEGIQRRAQLVAQRGE